MPIDVVCPCSMRFRAKEEFAGARVKCPGCGKPVAVPVPPMPAIVVDEDEPLSDADAEPSVWSKVWNALKSPSAPTPASTPPVSAPPAPDHRPGFARKCLYGIAWFSFLAAIISPVITASMETEQAAKVEYARTSKSLFEFSEAREKKRYLMDEAGHNARAAWICFVVAMAGLAASRK